MAEFAGIVDAFVVVRIFNAASQLHRVTGPSFGYAGPAGNRLGHGTAFNGIPQDGAFVGLSIH